MHARTVKEFHIHLVKKITSNQKLKKKKFVCIDFKIRSLNRMPHNSLFFNFKWKHDHFLIPSTQVCPAK